MFTSNWFAVLFNRHAVGDLRVERQPGQPGIVVLHDIARVHHRELHAVLGAGILGCQRQLVSGVAHVDQVGAYSGIGIVDRVANFLERTRGLTDFDRGSRLVGVGGKGAAAERAKFDLDLAVGKADIAGDAGKRL